MEPGVSHNRKDESIEEKARWFRSLSLAERMDMLCFFTDLMIEANPQMLEKKDAEPVEGSIQIISKK